MGRYLALPGQQWVMGNLITLGKANTCARSVLRRTDGSYKILEVANDKEQEIDVAI